MRCSWRKTTSRCAQMVLGQVSGPQSEHLTWKEPPVRKWMPLLAVCLGTFMLLVDVTIVVVALPHMAAGLRTSFSALQWVVDSYALTLAALLLAAGQRAGRDGGRADRGAGGAGHRRRGDVRDDDRAAQLGLSGAGPGGGLRGVGRGVRRCRGGGADPGRAAHAEPVVAVDLLRQPAGERGCHRGHLAGHRGGAAWRA